MAARVRAFDWSATPLGPVEIWPTAVRAVVELALASPIVASVAIGDERQLVYNDAAAALYGDRHPAALGRPLAEAFADSYPRVAALYDRVFAGEAVSVASQPLAVGTGNGGEVFDAYLTPVRDDDGAVVAAHMTGFEVGARHHAEAALRESEARYRDLFETMGQGYVEAEIVRDAGGRAVDCRLIELNPAFERLTGIPVKAARGRTNRELFPGIEDWWPETADRIVRSGVPETIEYAVAPLDRHYRVHFHPTSGDRFTALYEDVTDRKRTENVLRASGERQAFLLRLSDALRQLADPAAIKTAACRLLGELLGVNRVFYAEADRGRWFVTKGYEERVEPLPDMAFEMTDYGQWIIDDFHAGRPLVVRDMGADDRFSDQERAAQLALSINSALAVPLVKGGDLVAMLASHGVEPHDWTEQELALLDETAERTWAAVERARAEASLRDSEAKFRSLFESIDEGFAIMEAVRDGSGRVVDVIYRQANRAWERQIGFEVELGRKASELFNYDPAEAPWIKTWNHVLDTGESHRQEQYIFESDRWYNVQFSRIGAAGSDLIAAVFDDITERKRGEAVLRDSEERQTFLLKLSDALRAEPGVDAVANRAISMLAARLQLDRCYITFYRPADDAADFPYQVGNETVLPLPESVRLSDHPDAYERVRDQTYVVDDDFERHGLSEAERANSTALGMRAMLASTVRKGEMNPLASMVAVSSQPRHWTRGEIALVEEAAERTWAAVERARAEAALRESEERYRALFESMDEAYAVVEVLKDDAGRWSDFRFLAVNPAFMAHTGMPYPVGQTATELLGTPNPRWTELYGQALDAAETLRVEESEATLGSVFDLNIFTLDRARNRVAVLFTNITDRKIADAALHESEERQRLMVELVPALLWSVSPDGQEIALNEGWSTYTGQSEAKTQGYGWLDAVHPDDLPATRATFEHAFATGEPIERQHRIHKTGNGYRWHLVRQVPVRDEHGTITRWFGAAVDIHESKLAEQALDASERRLQTLVEGVPQLVWRAVDDGRWTWASPQWTAQTGQVEEDSHGFGWLEPVHPDDRERVKEIWAGAIERGEFHADYRLCHVEKHRYRWFQTRAMPVRDDRGAIIEWLGTSTDVDDLRGLQERQQVLVAELQHRTRNLMGVVRSTADRTGEASVDFADFRRRFRDRLEALARVQGLLSRLNETDRIAFDELIRTELTAMNGDAGRVMLDGPFGIRLRSSMVQTLAMALHELATNAVKYGALGQPRGFLAITWQMVDPDRRGRPRLRIDWRESGVTMPPLGASPQGGGQGRELIEKALPYQLSAETSFELGPDGVHCTITIPVSASTSEDANG